MSVYCPYCDSEDVWPVTEPDGNGQCEYRCNDCGEYFVDDAEGS